MKRMIVVETYEELQGYATQFAEGKINLLFVVGEPGHGKSKAFESATKGRVDCHGLDGHFTPLGFYADLWQNRDRNIWIDDVDNLYGERLIVQLLKSLCQTNEVKTMRWMSSKAIVIDGVDIPPQFQTKSRVAVITNDWKTLNKNVGALENRGIAIRFEPSPAEVHEKAGEWFGDREIYGYVGGIVPMLRRHDMRAYMHACELKQAGKDWRALVPTLLDMPEMSDAELAARIHANPSLTAMEKETEYAKRAKRKSRASFYRNLKRSLCLRHGKKMRL